MFAIYFGETIDNLLEIKMKTQFLAQRRFNWLTCPVLAPYGFTPNAAVDRAHRQASHT